MSLWVLTGVDCCRWRRIDAKHMLLPDCLTRPLLWAGLLNHALFHTLPLSDACLAQRRATCRCASLLGLSPDNRTRGLGYSDFKLLAALGARGAAGRRYLRYCSRRH
ncbi:prepilin peptidase [Enterobacter cloacae subsp. cloacae]|nr:prepilin peptidase [Enterobacter cloacae subsp. cloacae]